MTTTARRPLGTAAHVHRLRAQPQGVDAHHLNASRSQAAHSAAIGANGGAADGGDGGTGKDRAMNCGVDSATAIEAAPGRGPARSAEQLHWLFEGIDIAVL